MNQSPQGKTTGQKPHKRDTLASYEGGQFTGKTKVKVQKGPPGRFRVSSVEFKQKLVNQPNRDEKCKPQAGQQTKQLTSACHLPPAGCIIPGTQQILPHLILTTTSGGRCYYHHFIGLSCRSQLT